ncbi:MAG: winged helix-turn-helix transcriptional regulator [Lachnospiraceae bacterium]|mgnify:FL=1|nr:winged helix-turn-helix transcriptional regulator [Lachnospiraceae bacterium]
MSLGRKEYEDISLLIAEGKYKELEGVMESYNSEVLMECVSLFQDSKLDSLTRTLKKSDYLRTSLLDIIVCGLSFQIGFFVAMLKIFGILAFSSSRKENFYEDMNALYHKARVSAILHYLLKNPDSQHKTIAEKNGLKANHLSQLMRELEAVGCVARYATGKRSFYSLTKEGETFARKKEQEQNILNDELYAYKFSPEKYNIKLRPMNTENSEDKYIQRKPSKNLNESMAEMRATLYA